ncbi:hypothetical protein RRG08_022318 [Elysia crispata]|uniref:Uncharacterized protein n=1 Tax=Elysia crispata TaxID=231223 RepID=A0AAE1DK26_9GAST|nr:hypothetical protein RRG08_022318 [Elysia crispata]
MKVTVAVLHCRDRICPRKINANCINSVVVKTVYNDLRSFALTESFNFSRLLENNKRRENCLKTVANAPLVRTSPVAERYGEWSSCSSHFVPRLPLTALDLHRTIPDCPGLHRTTPGCPGLHRTTPGCPGLHRTTPDCPGLHRTTPGCPGLTPDYPGLPWTTPDYPGLPWTTPDYPRLSWAALEYTGLLPDYHGLPWTTPDYPRTIMGCPGLPPDYPGLPWTTEDYSEVLRAAPDWQ